MSFYVPYKVIYNLNGTPKKSVECERCSAGYQPSADLRSCIPCHSSFWMLLNKNNSDLLANFKGTCHCPESGYRNVNGVCLPNSNSDQDQDSVRLDTSSSTAFKLEYERHQLDSSIFREHIRLSSLMCKGDKRNQTACQILANLCTLNLHSYDSESPTTACNIYHKLQSGATHSQHVPKLYHREFDNSGLFNKPIIPQQFNMDFSSHSSDINITTAKFSFDGKFLGLSDLSDHIPCSDPPLVQGISRKFGATYKTHCTMGIQELWKKYKYHDMYFLDPYVSYRRSGQNSELDLYNIPVKVLNFRKMGEKTNLVIYSV